VQKGLSLAEVSAKPKVIGERVGHSGLLWCIHVARKPDRLRILAEKTMDVAAAPKGHASQWMRPRLPIRAEPVGC
jgi:hypothetical protein